MKNFEKFENNINKFDLKNISNKYSIDISLILNGSFVTYAGYKLYKDIKNIKSMDNTLGFFQDLEYQYGPLTFEDFLTVCNDQIFQKDFIKLLKINNYPQDKIDKVIADIKSEGFYNYTLSYGELQTAINGQENIFFKEMFGEISQGVIDLFMVILYSFFINKLLKIKN